MTSFELYRKKCETILEGIRPVRFMCHIFYNNYTLETIEDDLQRLCSINESDVLFFVGVWERAEYEDDGFGFECGYNLLTSAYPENQYEACQTSNRFYNLYSNLLGGLLSSGVELDIVESLIPKLYKVYQAQALAEGFREFEIVWKGYLDEWRHYIDHEFNKKDVD